MHSRIRPFWPRSGAIGVSTTIGAPQATQGLVRRASFICLLLLPLMSYLLIDAGCGDSAEPLAAWRTRQAEDASVTVFARCFTDRERAVIQDTTSISLRELHAACGLLRLPCLLVCLCSLGIAKGKKTKNKQQEASRARQPKPGPARTSQHQAAES